MTRCFPADPHWGSGRHAERAAWEALAGQLPDTAMLFHSVNLIEGPREQEIDLLVVWPGRGIAAIEVKGGYVGCEDGAWFQSDLSNKGNEKKRPIGSPAEQAQSGRHLLERYLRRRLGVKRLESRFAHLVALPYTPVSSSWASAECPRTMLVDRDDLPDVADYVAAAIDRHGSGYAQLSDDLAEEMKSVLVSDLPSQIDALTLVSEHDSYVEQLTSDQAVILDHLRHFPRMKITGGAGSGKTWLALEQARRMSRDGQRVALLCYSRGLGRYFERVTAHWRPSERPAYVGLFHQLPVTWGAEPGSDDHSDDWEHRLPSQLGELAQERPASELFDSIIVDEAQDFGELWWDSLMACLRNPETGGIFVFIDERQRVFPRYGTDPVDFPPIALDENIRNTKQIAQLFSSLTGGTIKTRGLPGVPVRLVDVPAEDAVDAGDSTVETLLDEGWDPGRIALLTTYRRHPEHKNNVETLGWSAYWDDFFAESDVFYGHVLGFKGLERSAVVLAVNGFSDMERARELLYVGLSRARSLLVLVGPRGRIAEVGGGGVRNRLASAQPLTVEG